MRPALALGALVLLLCVAGCGTDPKQNADLGQARSVVERFAAAGDASACDLLTADALRNVYGDFKGAKAKAKAKCVAQSTKFKGEQITIIRSELLDDLTAKVVAHNAANTFSYSVNLRRLSGRKPWRIDSISQAKLVQ
jgi:hypothetical protein